jgi:hypothetical protein
VRVNATGGLRDVVAVEADPGRPAQLAPLEELARGAGPELVVGVEDDERRVPGSDLLRRHLYPS